MIYLVVAYCDDYEKAPWETVDEFYTLEEAIKHKKYRDSDKNCKWAVIYEAKEIDE